MIVGTVVRGLVSILLVSGLLVMGTVAVAIGAAAIFWGVYLVLWTVAIAFVVDSTDGRWLSGWIRERAVDRRNREGNPLAVVRARYARGEIDDDDLDRMLDSLLETNADPSVPVALVER